MTSASASVSMRKNTPDDRTASQPAAAAINAPAAAAVSSGTGAAGVPCAATQPAAYAPTPKYAACPSDGSPPMPTSRSRLAASSANTSIRVSVVVAYGARKNGAAASATTHAAATTPARQ